MSLTLVTGAAGFIGCELALGLLTRGESVLGVDCLTDYYDPKLKQARLKRLAAYPKFRFERLDIADGPALEGLFAQQRPGRVLHMAAQVGVRYSLANPQAYTQSNLLGFANILEICRKHAIEHLVFASSSSVYGANSRLPYSVRDGVDHPLSYYAATKRANELMAHAYAHLYGLPVTGLRFFTVYGPWGRPDMAPFKFTRAILAGDPIEVYNHGNMQRDFTYIDDVVEAVLRVLELAPAASIDARVPDHPGRSSAPFRLYNIGNHSPVELLRFIAVLEKELGKKAVMNFLPRQPGDVLSTCADVDDLVRDAGFSPGTPIEEGLRRMVAWHRAFYG